MSILNRMGTRIQAFVDVFVYILLSGIIVLGIALLGTLVRVLIRAFMGV